MFQFYNFSLRFDQHYFFRKQYRAVPVKYNLYAHFLAVRKKARKYRQNHPPIKINSINTSLFSPSVQLYIRILFISYNNQNISMPFIYRTLNRFPQNASPMEHVKQEEQSIEVEEQSVLSAEEINAVQNKEGNEGRWNEDENFRFVLFVHYYQDIFASQHKRKVCKIFRTFSEYLTERTAAQCRSHYQKMIIKHKTIAKLKKHYKTLYGDKEYNSEFQRFKTEWQATHPNNLKTTSQIKQFKEIAIQTEDERVQPVCQNCMGVRSETDLLTSNSSAFRPYVYWDLNQFHNPSGLNFYYWVPQQSTSQLLE